MRLSPSIPNAVVIHAGAVDLLQITDGEMSWICSIDEFLADNATDEQACEAVRGLYRGQAVDFIGGRVERIA